MLETFKTHSKLSLAFGALASIIIAFPVATSASNLQLANSSPVIISDLSGPETDTGINVYIVQLTDDAVANYMGDVNGMAATSNRATGASNLDTDSAASREYSGYLREVQLKFIADSEAAIGRSLNVNYDYQYAFNGVAIQLTFDEARTVAKLAGVKHLSREKLETLLTDAGPAWIGAPAIWNGGSSGSKGEGIVIAVLDTGINSDHPSFGDLGDDGYDHSNPLGSGSYVPGSYCDVTDASFCNDKLIGAWDFVASDGTVPEDNDGHGSHTASTAAGNVIDDAELLTPTTSAFFNISGVAPHANIIAYDVCDAGCPGASLVAAIEQVVIDNGNIPGGINALNYSISGGGDPYNDPVELGFLAAAAAGVYVAASAGNSGPAAGTVAHLGPWVSTTGASTHNRTIVNSVVDLNSSGGGTADIAGLGFTSGYGPAPVINSADLEGAFPGSTLCGTGVLGDFAPPWPPGTFNGEIVACTRGTYGRVEKGANVLAAGAGGFILMDNGAGIVGDAHVLPGVHISQADGATLSAWLAANAGNSPKGTIDGFIFDYSASSGDVMAGFSSRGPQSAFSVLKPDLTAPGASIFAAEANGQAALTPEYQFLSGTSMSSPHNAGAGALMSAVQPDWTPFQIRSAIMMTSSTDAMLKEDGVTPADPFDMGAGRIDLTNAQNAGLVLDETEANFLAADPALGGDPSTLNLASMQNNRCVGECSWTRELENVTNKTIKVELSTSGDPGLDLHTSPGDDLKVKKGKTETITVTANTTLAAPGWNFGMLEMDNKKGPDLHMPIAVFAANSSNESLLTKTVDQAIASEDDVLTYQINITNQNYGGQIDLEDVLPGQLEYVDGSATEVVVDGTTISPFSHSDGVMTWSGELDAADMAIAPSPLFGYIPLAAFGIPPTPNPSGCDDGGYAISGLDIYYNGEHYTTAIWSVNGTLELGTASGQTAGYFNGPLPDPTAPNNLLAPFWSDLFLCAGGGSWTIAALAGGGTTWDIFEWTAIRDLWFFGFHSFQIWLERGTSNITFTYGSTDPTYATIGAENFDGSVGDMWWIDFTGTPPDPAVDLGVIGIPGGSATLTFQAEIDDCEADDDSDSDGDNDSSSDDDHGVIVNRANVTSGDSAETAIAVTQCVESDDDSDSGDDDESDSD